MTKPAIVAPVSRFLAVADADRSVAFYRDVLGFEATTRKTIAACSIETT
jgi:catechol-2,3-dioxygenase